MIIFLMNECLRNCRNVAAACTIITLFVGVKIPTNRDENASRSVSVFCNVDGANPEIREASGHMYLASELFLLCYNIIEQENMSRFISSLIILNREQGLHHSPFYGKLLLGDDENP